MGEIGTISGILPCEIVQMIALISSGSFRNLNTYSRDVRDQLVTELCLCAQPGSVLSGYVEGIGHIGIGANSDFIRNKKGPTYPEPSTVTATVHRMLSLKRIKVVYSASDGFEQMIVLKRLGRAALHALEEQKRSHQLESLEFAHMRSDELVDYIGVLTGLRSLVAMCWTNDVCDGLLYAIGESCTLLTSLNLSRATLDGHVLSKALDRLPALAELTLDMCTMDEGAYTALAKATNLQTLSLLLDDGSQELDYEHRDHEGVSPDVMASALASMPSLTSVHLGVPCCCKVLHALLPGTLKELTLETQVWDNAGLVRLAQFTGLSKLVLRSRYIIYPYNDLDVKPNTGKIASVLGYLGSLTDLEITGIDVDAEIIGAIGVLTRLCSLHLESNDPLHPPDELWEIPFALAPALHRLNDLSTLNIIFNEQFLMPGPEGEATVDAIGCLPSLTSLSLNGNSLGMWETVSLEDSIAPALEKLTTLTFLNLGRNNITEAELDAIVPALSGLRSLDIGYNHASTETLQELMLMATRLTNLQARNTTNLKTNEKIAFIRNVVEPSSVQIIMI
jgi:hypothetical protein